MFVPSQLYDGQAIANRQMLGNLLAMAFADDPARFQQLISTTMDAFDGIQYGDREGVSGEMVKHNALAEIEVLAKLVPMLFPDYAKPAAPPQRRRKAHWRRIGARSSP